MSEASILRFASTGKSVHNAPNETAECKVVYPFGAGKSVQDVPPEVVLSNNALAERHMRRVQCLFDAALATCKASTKDMNLSGPAHCELTKHALMEMIQVAFEVRMNSDV